MKVLKETKTLNYFTLTLYKVDTYFEDEVRVEYADGFYNRTKFYLKNCCIDKELQFHFSSEKELKLFLRKYVIKKYKNHEHFSFATSKEVFIKNWQLSTQQYFWTITGSEIQSRFIEFTLKRI